MKKKQDFWKSNKQFWVYGIVAAIALSTPWALEQYDNHKMRTSSIIINVLPEDTKEGRISIDAFYTNDNFYNLDNGYYSNNNYYKLNNVTIPTKKEKVYLYNSTNDSILFDSRNGHDIAYGKKYKLSQYNEYIKDLGLFLIPPHSYLELDKVPYIYNHTDEFMTYNFRSQDFSWEILKERRDDNSRILANAKQKLKELEIGTKAKFVDNSTHIDTLLTQPMVYKGKTYDFELDFHRNSTKVVNTSNRRLAVYKLIYASDDMVVKVEDYSKLNYHFIEPYSTSENEPNLVWESLPFLYGHKDSKKVHIVDCIDYADSPTAIKAIMTIEAARKGLLE